MRLRHSRSSAHSLRNQTRPPALQYQLEKRCPVDHSLTIHAESRLTVNGLRLTARPRVHTRVQYTYMRLGGQTLTWKSTDACDTCANRACRRRRWVGTASSLKRVQGHYQFTVHPVHCSPVNIRQSIHYSCNPKCVPQSLRAPRVVGARGT